MRTDKLVNQLLVSAAVLGLLTLVGGKQAEAATPADNTTGLNTGNEKVVSSNVNASEVKLGSHTGEGTGVKANERGEQPSDVEANQQTNTAVTTKENGGETNKDAATVTNLGPATAEQVDQAKEKAQQVYQATGKAQTITAVSDVTAPTEAATSLPKGVTASAVIHYVNYLTKESISVSKVALGLSGDDEVNGSYTYNSKMPEKYIDNGTATIRADTISPRIAHYGIVGYLDANGKFTTTAPTKGNLVYGKQVDLTTYYAPLSDLQLEYVDEEDPSNILCTYTIPVGNAQLFDNDVAGNDSYNFTYYTPDIYGYEYDAVKTDQSKLKGKFINTQTVTDANPTIITFMYRKTDQPISEYASKYPVIVNPTIISWVGPEKISTPKQGVQHDTDLDDVKALDFPGYTLMAFYAALTGREAPRLIGSNITSYAEDKPTKVQYIDESTGKEIMVDGASSTELLSGSDDTGWTWKAEQKSFDGYTFDQVVGPTSGTFDAIERVITFLYKPVNTGNAGAGQPTNQITNTTVGEPTQVNPSDGESSTPVPGEDTTTSTTGKTVTTPVAKEKTKTKNTSNEGTAEHGAAVPENTGTKVMTSQSNGSTVKAEDNTVNTGHSSAIKAQLPQTDENHSSIFSLFGAILLSGLGLLGVGKKKRRD